jgi:hypothetical protein
MEHRGASSLSSCAIKRSRRGFSDGAQIMAAALAAAARLSGAERALVKAIEAPAAR